MRDRNFVDQPEGIAEQQAEDLAGDDQRDDQRQVKNGAEGAAKTDQAVVENDRQH